MKKPLEGEGVENKFTYNWSRRPFNFWIVYECYLVIF